MKSKMPTDRRAPRTPTDWSRRTFLTVSAATFVTGCAWKEAGDTGTLSTPTTTRSGTTDTTGTTTTETTTETSTTVVDDAWQLPADHSLGYAPLKAVYPLADSVTGANARHRRALVDELYQVPIGVHFGFFSYRYELISGPTGATMAARTLQWSGDSMVRPDGYGVVEWTPDAVGGPHTFVVRVTDQAGATLELEWTVEVVADDAQNFIFLQPGAPDGGDGTKNSPLQNVTQAQDGSHGGKLVYVRGGVLVADQNILMGEADLPAAFIGYPGEDPVWDCSGLGRCGQAVSTSADYFVSGIDFQDLGAGAPRSQIYGFIHWGASVRQTWWRAKCTNPSVGTVADDNNAFVHTRRVSGYDTGDAHGDFFISECQMSGAGSSSNGTWFYDGYSMNNILIDNNQLVDNLSENLINVKGEHLLVTVRGNRVFGGSSQLIDIYLDDANLGRPTDAVEVCYNRVRCSDIRSKAIGVGSGRDLPQVHGTVRVYRNSTFGEQATQNFAEGYVDSSATANVKQYDKGWELGYWSNEADNVVYSPDESPFDGDLWLQGQARTDHLGLRGADIA